MCVFYLALDFAVTRFTARVTAFNYLGNVSSEPVEIHVVEPIDSVQIVTDGEPVIGHLIKFHAYHFAGSDVTYEWEFGDGTSNVTKHDKISHTYDK